MTGGGDDTVRSAAMPADAAWLDAEGAVLRERVAALIARGAGAPRLPDAEFAALALTLSAWQRGRCPAVDRVVRAFAGEGAVASLEALPGVPSDAFKTARIACFAPEHAVRVFRTSGTTAGERRGEHAFADLALYDAAALASGARYLLPGARPYRFVLLAEPEREAPHSSLSYMLARFAERFGDRAAGSPDAAWAVRGGRLDLARVKDTLDAATRADAPVALLGASFALVHLDDALPAQTRWSLPPGSVAMPTGGFKGRSRALAPEELFALVARRFGLARSAIVQEYGMTELSSQAYEAHAADPRAEQGRYAPPPWMRVDAVDPETLAVRPAGSAGILRIIDLANVGSSVAVQTADVGVVHADGTFEVHGRAPGATPRGCARALDALLAGGGDKAGD